MSPIGTSRPFRPKPQMIALGLTADIGWQLARDGAVANDTPRCVRARVVEVLGLTILLTYIKSTVALLCEYSTSIIEKVRNEETYL